MKLIRLFWTLNCLIWAQSIFAQSPHLEFTLRYSTTQSRYEVYARPDATQSSFNWGPSQISIVAPISVGNTPFNVTSVAGGAWLDNSQVFAPTADSLHDFHGVGSLGAPTTFTGNVEKLIFHFTLAGGSCTYGLRLYINGVDPSSSAPGMAGGDFSNTVYAIVPGFPEGFEAYLDNYNNAGTSCNAPPLANNDAVSTNEDIAITFNPLTNDTDPNGNIDPTSVMVLTGPANGMTLVNPLTGQITYTPNGNFNGINTLTYSICDTGTPILCDTATVTIIVNPVNDPPVAVNDAATTNEDVAVSIPVLANDSDVDGLLVASTVDLDPATMGVQTTFTVAGQGTFTVNPATGIVTFTPLANFNGITTPIPYSVCDNGTPLPAMCAQAQITVTVNAVNDPPDITQPAVSTPEDTPIPICPTLSDPDAGNVLTLALCATPSNGTAAVGPGNCITFTPALNFTGTTTLCIQVCDQAGLCDSVLVPVTVTPVNDPPTIAQPPVSTPEDTPITICPTLSDPDAGDVLTISLCAPASNGTVVSGPGNCLIFTPALNYTGTTTLCIQVCDQGNLCNSVMVPVTVTPVNDAPVAVNDAATTNEDTPVTIPVLTNDSDVDGSLNPATVDLDPAPGVQTTFTVAGQGTFSVNPLTGVVTFTPVADFNGLTTPILYSVCDNGTPLPAMCATATITVTVNPVNDPPVALNDTPSTNEDLPVMISILSNDTDPDGMLVPATVDLNPGTPGVQTTFTVAGQGTFTVNPVTGVVTFTPVADFNGTTTPVPYSVCDNGTPLPAMCAQATITVTVNPVNDAPIANNDTPSTNEDTPVTFNPLSNDTDVENNIDPTTVHVVSGPSNGTISVNPVNGMITYVPNSNFSGTDVLTYSVCDLGSPVLCDTATVTITVIFDPIAKLQVKVMLQGAMLGTSNGLMRDDLRAGGYLPLTEPYTALSNPHFTHVGGGGGETTTTTVLNANAGTPNAIVDWVFVELRSGTDSSLVIQTRSALVQRDGDVVSAADGVSMLTFPGKVGQSYFIAVKHRNHLGAMTSTKALMTNDGTVVDFINASNAQVYNRPGAINYDGSEMVTVQGKRALWAGNTNGNNKVKYQGTSSDNIPVLTPVLNFPGNAAGTYNYNLALGYFSGDVNLDGKVKYQGTANDVSFIFVNMVGLYTTLNTAGLYNYDLFLEQLPN